MRVSLGQHSQAAHEDGINQDFHGAMLPRGAQLQSKGIALALADGIGSSRVSQVASAAAVRGFLDDYYATSEAWSVRRSAQRVLAATNAWLHAQNQRSHARFDKDSGYVCTFSALILKGREAHLLHVGDSRIYRVHGASLEQLTQDHRVHLSSAESYLGRALGVNAGVEIDYHCLQVEPGDVFLLATDGACNALDGAAVQVALAQSAGDLDRAAEQLVARARAHGSDDDATLQLLSIEALPEPGSDSLPLSREGLALPPSLAPRMGFEGYTIVRSLHASARSHVHLAVDDESGAQVVVKTPSVDLREQPDYLDRFVLEEWVARRIHHPNVLRPAVNERPRRHLFTAMEFAPGQTLAQWMTDHPRPSLDVVRAIVTQIAMGLCAFHGKEMLHQDLRPENVMVDDTGTVRIIDFAAVHVAGLAEGMAEPEARAILGSLQYTAPEYFTGGAGTERSDLFSLAVLAYQMLSGHLPYGLQVTQLRGPSDLRRLRYEPLRHRRPELPAWLDAVLAKALHPDPAKRQESPAEFAQDLKKPGAQFHRSGAPPLIERHPVRFWQAATLVLALAVIVLLGQLLGR
ncbi:bifunctional protein-serine/threonine kinase/phosphatase [Variovorax dokdonensis]|uniref:Bifunctional protein-serine/threonine kinase/phosphatase n=1 Tax=Variovorax dokdonensis TaxID=344883 RepID=A0ABT7NA63_9BURK|nr:bifunctional protein-serine/threonine kinase/phosphatase [Variovorax dokdonensis]MDM0044750.1 bifunctional protein-serine/threonine kinase/phosphatase [Variovorax dokdonensis]